MTLASPAARSTRRSPESVCCKSCTRRVRRWASYIIGEKARKLHKYDSRRCDLLARLEKMADAAEAAPIPAALQVSQSSPALRKVVGAQQTVSLQPRQHSVLGGEGIVIAAPAFCE
jgi:hypothetical protein